MTEDNIRNRGDTCLNEIDDSCTNTSDPRSSNSMNTSGESGISSSTRGGTIEIEDSDSDDFHECEFLEEEDFEEDDLEEDLEEDDCIDGASSLMQLKMRSSSSSNDSTCSLVPASGAIIKKRSRRLKKVRQKNLSKGHTKHSKQNTKLSKQSTSSMKSVSSGNLSFKRSYGIEDVVRMVLVNKLSPMEAIRAAKNCVTRQHLNFELKKYQYEGPTSTINLCNLSPDTDISSLTIICSNKIS